MWAAIVRGAPEIKTSCFSLASSPFERSSDWSSRVRSLASDPALRPIASSRAAHFAFSAFSLSSSCELEDSGSEDRRFFDGAVGLETNALITASFLSFAIDELSRWRVRVSHRPNPSWKAVDSKNSFSEAIAKNQNCSSCEESWQTVWATSWSKVLDMSQTLLANSEADDAFIAEMNAKSPIGVWRMAWANASLKTGNERILSVHLLAWAMINLPTETSCDHNWNQRHEHMNEWLSGNCWLITAQENAKAKLLSNSIMWIDVITFMKTCCSQCWIPHGSGSRCRHAHERSIDIWDPTALNPLGAFTCSAVEASWSLLWK